MNNIISVEFNENKNVEFASGLIQWDIGQVLKITGLNLTGNIEVHFSLKETIGEAQRSICTVDNGILTVAIPGFVLQAETTYNYNAYAFVYVSNATAGMTVKKIVFDIKARPKPADWVTPDEPDTLSQVLDLIDKKAEKSDTLAGYGIKDAYTKNEIDKKIKEGSSGLTAEQLENIDAVPEIRQEARSAMLVANAAGSDALNAQSKADNAYGLAGTAMDAATGANQKAVEAEAIAKGAQQAISFKSYSDMWYSVMARSGGDFNVGQNIFIVTPNVPDLWVSAVMSDAKVDDFTSDDDIVNALKETGYIQIGFFSLSPLESKVNLSEYQTKAEAEAAHSDIINRINGLTTTALSKQDAIIISSNVSTDGTVMMNNNTEARLTSVPLVNDVPTLILNLPDTEYGIALDYMSWVMFSTCDTTPSVTVVGDISWSGVDCDETGAFTPVAGVNYRLQVCNIGINEFEPKIIGNVARW